MRIPKPNVLLAVVVAAGAVVAVPAMAAQDLPETRIVSSATATPNKAGTLQHPRGTAISAEAQLMVEPDFEPPVVTSVEILVGKGLVWNRGTFVTCSKQALDRHGPSGCPRESIMGAATATGMADTVAARLDLVFVNGGKDVAYAYATLNNPARVRETLVVKSTKVDGGAWGHREVVDVPRSLQIVAGVPLRLTRIRMKIGGKSYAKTFIASTSCPKGGWKYQVTAHYLFDELGQTSQDVGTGSIACTK